MIIVLGIVLVILIFISRWLSKDDHEYTDVEKIKLYNIKKPNLLHRLFKTDKWWEYVKWCENAPGYHPMTGQGPCASPWNWGPDREIAQKLCDEKNKELGLNQEDAFRIVGSSMFANMKVKK